MAGELRFLYVPAGAGYRVYASPDALFALLRPAPSPKKPTWEDCIIQAHLHSGC